MSKIFGEPLYKFHNNTALVTESGDEITYAEFLGHADKIASRAERRSVVFQICRNDAESVTAYAGFLRNGVVPALISNTMNARMFTSLKETYRPSYLFLPSADGGEQGETIYEFGCYSLVKTGYETDYAVHDDLALLLTTSGSTGSPKLVRVTYENIKSNTDSIIEYLGITQGDRAITTLPMSYTYGLSIINTHLRAGAALILTERTLMERGFWNMLKTHNATTFGGVPYTYEMLMKLRFERMELPCLRYLTQSGSKLPPELCAEFTEICERKGIRFIVMYGQTEATARIAYLPWANAKNRPGSMGIAIPGGELWLAADDGSRVTTSGVTGELIYKGKNVTPGYAEDRFDLCKGDERGGVLETGDMAYFDEEGFFFIAGRKKRFLKIFGSRVSLDETEDILKRAGFNCAVAGTDDNMRIFATLEKTDEIRRFIINSTGINPAGFSVTGIDAIPRNASGKVLYSELADL